QERVAALAFASTASRPSRSTTASPHVARVDTERRRAFMGADPGQPRPDNGGLFQQVLKSDVADIQGGTTPEGIHLAPMVGSVDLLQRCFTGPDPRRSHRLAPDAAGITWHVAVFDSLSWPPPAPTVSGRGAEISVDPRDVPPVDVECPGRWN